MSSVEQKARELFDRECPIDVARSGAAADIVRKAAIRAIAAALREQPEARGVVDVDAIASSLVDWMLTKAMPNGDLLHASVACDYAGMANFKRALSKQLRAALTAAQQPVQEGGGDE